MLAFYSRVFELDLVRIDIGDRIMTIQGSIDCVSPNLFPVFIDR